MKTFKSNGYNYQVTGLDLFSTEDAMSIFTAESGNIMTNGFLHTADYELTADESDIANQELHTDINIDDLSKVIDNESVLTFNSGNTIYNRINRSQFSALFAISSETLSVYGSFILTKDEDKLTIAFVGIVGLSE